MDTRSSLLYPAPDLQRHRLKSNQIRDWSFGANPPQVQTQASYDKLKCSVALMRRAVSTAAAIFPQPVDL